MSLTTLYAGDLTCAVSYDPRTGLYVGAVARHGAEVAKITAETIPALKAAFERQADGTASL